MSHLLFHYHLLLQKQGLTFLAAEIGETGASTLPEIATIIAEAVGYQKLALQMIGAMHCPISRKKVALGWEAIRELIDDIRSELGLSAAPFASG